jgi:hypothetical protein
MAKIGLSIEENLDRPVEMAGIKPEGGACQFLLVVFGQWPLACIRRIPVELLG